LTVTPDEEQKALEKIVRSVQAMGRVWSLGPDQDVDDAATIGISVAELQTLDTTIPVSLRDLDRTDELKTRAQVLRWARDTDNRKRTDRAAADKLRLPLTAYLALPWDARNGLQRDDRQRWAIAHPRNLQPRSDKPRKPRAKMSPEEAAQRQRASKSASQKRNPEAHNKANAAYMKRKRLEQRQAKDINKV
jgi:hypothetical protein